MKIDIKNKFKKPRCKLCDNPTQVIYNINFTAVSICESCVRTLVLQEVNDVFTKLNS